MNKGLICLNCDSEDTIESLRARGKISCCPERKMVTHREAAYEWLKGLYPGIQCPDGEVLDELDDYRRFLKHGSKVYDHATRGQISKVNTHASEVISVIDDVVSEEVREAVDEAIGKDFWPEWAKTIQKRLKEFGCDIDEDNPIDEVFDEWLAGLDIYSTADREDIAQLIDTEAFTSAMRIFEYSDERKLGWQIFDHMFGDLPYRIQFAYDRADKILALHRVVRVPPGAGR